MSAKCALIADSHGVLVKVHVLLNYYMAWPCGSQHRVMKSIAVKKSLVKLVAFWPYAEVKWNCRFTRHQARVYSSIRGQSCVDVTSLHSAIYLHCMSVYLLVVAKNRPTVELFAVSSPHITSHETTEE